MSIPKSEKIVMSFRGTPSGKLYAVTRAGNGTYHLYEKRGEEYMHLKKRSTDPLFKEVSS